MKRNTIIAIIALGALVIAASVWVARYNGLLPVAAGVEAEAYDGLFNTILAIAFGFFLIVEGVLIYAIIRFRRKPNDDTDGLPIHENLTLELFWTAIPTVIVMWVAIYSFDVYTTMAGNSAMGMAHSHPAGKHGHEIRLASADGGKLASTMPSNMTDILSIDVSAMQFAWIFNYSESIATAELHVPVGRRIRLNLSAVDVIHAFWVPQLRLKQDVIPGEATYLEFVPTKVGEYPVVCAELCGAYHGGMRASMVIDTPEDYAQWLIEQEEVAANSSQNIVATASQPHSAAHAAEMHMAESMGLGLHVSPELIQQLH